MEYQIPAQLLNCLSSATITVESWSAESDALILHVYKDDNEEHGTLRFRGVRQVCLSPRFSLCGMRAGGADALPAWYPGLLYDGELALESGERVRVEHVFAFDVDCGPPGFVLAQSLEYEILEDLG